MNVYFYPIASTSELNSPTCLQGAIQRPRSSSQLSADGSPPARYAVLVENGADNDSDSDADLTDGEFTPSAGDMADDRDPCHATMLIDLNLALSETDRTAQAIRGEESSADSDGGSSGSSSAAQVARSGQESSPSRSQRSKSHSWHGAHPGDAASSGHNGSTHDGAGSDSSHRGCVVVVILPWVASRGCDTLISTYDCHCCAAPS